jgi:hypothetical protein
LGLSYTLHNAGAHAVDPLIIPIVGILMPLLLVPTILMMKHRQKQREWEHLERMRAMNGPQPLTRLGNWVGAGGVAAIGAGVPIASVLAALVTTLTWRTMPFEETPVPPVAWACALLISLGGFGTSLLLALMQSRTQRQLDSAAAAELRAEKPVFDPDTFDVVGTRG